MNQNRYSICLWNGIWTVLPSERLQVTWSSAASNMTHSVVNVSGELRLETKVGEKKRGGLFVYRRVRESRKGEVILGEQVGKDTQEEKPPCKEEARGIQR